jgi:hypothetical protein
MTTVKHISAAYGRRVLVAALTAALALGSAGTAMAADPITDDNVEAALAAAKTPADHEALAAYFTAKSKAAQAEVGRHERMSHVFGGKAKPQWEAHCRSLQRTYEEQAKDYAALASEQKAVAAALAK